jgi:hypothetical protein
MQGPKARGDLRVLDEDVEDVIIHLVSLNDGNVIRLRCTDGEVQMNGGVEAGAVPGRLTISFCNGRFLSQALWAALCVLSKKAVTESTKGW